MSLLNRAALYWNTARHLRPVQLAGRLWYHAWRPSPDLRAPAPVRSKSGEYARPIARAASLIGPVRFDLLGHVHELPARGGWDSRELAKLWRYNLHYFDDLNAADSEQRASWHAALVQRWIAENPPARGTGWEPFPTSLRIVNWIKWALRGHDLPAPARASLCVQARWLMRRLEHHLLGNHLLANAKALIHAGAFFDGAEAQRWYTRGMQIVERELPEQVLADGGHFELSPMYHAIVLEDLLDLINVLRARVLSVPHSWLAALSGMRSWLDVMTHPDGEIAFFNDAAFGIAPSRRDLEDYAQRLGLPPAVSTDQPLVTLDASGYVRLTAGDAWLICDCAAVGADYLPAHAHADTLSFELSIAGRRVLVNSGTSEYGAGEERQRQRGTSAHNTVMVDRQSSSEVWGGFRVARRARARLRVLAPRLPVAIEGSHDGYRRLPGRNLHRRRWTLDEQSLRVEDEVTGSFAQAEAVFHLHPDVDATMTAQGEVMLGWREAGSASMRFEGADSVDIQPCTWHPRFGAVLPNRRVTARFSGPRLTTLLRWTSR